MNIDELRECKHHIIDLCKGNIPYSKIYFSIDFEPVELWMSKEIIETILQKDTRAYYGLITQSSLFFWQAIFDECCKILLKEKREVVARKDADSKMPKFGNTVYEFVGAGTGFNWMYFSETKTYHFNKFYDWLVACAGKKIYENEEQLKYPDWYFHQHYENVYKHLKKQGLAVGKSYYEPSHETIDNLIKHISHGNS